MKREEAIRVGRKFTTKAHRENLAKVLATASKQPVAPTFSVKGIGTTSSSLKERETPVNKRLVKAQIDERWQNFTADGLEAEKIKNTAEVRELTKSITRNYKVRKIAGDFGGQPVGWSGQSGDEAEAWNSDQNSDSGGRTIADDDSGQGTMSGKIDTISGPNDNDGTQPIDSPVNKPIKDTWVSDAESETDTYGTDPSESPVNASTDAQVTSAVDEMFADADLLLALSRAIREKKLKEGAETGTPYPASGFDVTRTDEDEDRQSSQLAAQGQAAGAWGSVGGAQGKAKAEAPLTWVGTKPSLGPVPQAHYPKSDEGLFSKPPTLKAEDEATVVDNPQGQGMTADQYRTNKPRASSAPEIQSTTFGAQPGRKGLGIFIPKTPAKKSKK